MKVVSEEFVKVLAYYKLYPPLVCWERSSLPLESMLNSIADSGCFWANVSICVISSCHLQRTRSSCSFECFSRMKDVIDELIPVLAYYMLYLRPVCSDSGSLLFQIQYLILVVLEQIWASVSAGPPNCSVADGFTDFRATWARSASQLLAYSMMSWLRCVQRLVPPVKELATFSTWFCLFWTN